MSKLVYISHPYGGIEEEKQHTEKIFKELAKNNDNCTYISPIHCFGCMYQDVEYYEGLHMCLELLKKCDEILVFNGSSMSWKQSTGCTEEVKFAKDNNIPMWIEEVV